MDNEHSLQTKLLCRCDEDLQQKKAGKKKIWEIFEKVNEKEPL